MVAAVNVGIYLILAASFRLDWNGSKIGRPMTATTAIILILAVGAVITYGRIRLQQIDRIQAAAPSAHIAAVQGNIAQSDKWDDAYKGKTIEIYNRLSAGLKQRSPDLIVWPETAAPRVEPAACPFATV